MSYPRVADESPSSIDWRLAPTGRVTVAEAGALRDAALRAFDTGRPVVFDAAGIEYLDTSAVQVVAALAQSLKRHGREFRVTGLSADVAAGLEAVGLQALLAATPSPR